MKHPLFEAVFSTSKEQYYCSLEEKCKKLFSGVSVLSKLFISGLDELSWIVWKDDGNAIPDTVVTFATNYENFKSLLLQQVFQPNCPPAKIIFVQESSDTSVIVRKIETFSQKKVPLLLESQKQFEVSLVYERLKNQLAEVENVKAFKLASGENIDQGTFLFELIQNAVDCNCTEISFDFDVQTKQLIFEHNGRPFNFSDIKSLCAVGCSEKVGKIGHKGRGFKSVYKVFNGVKIYSPTYNFEFKEMSEAKGCYLPEYLLPKTDFKVTRFEFKQKLHNKENISTLLTKLSTVPTFAILKAAGATFVKISIGKRQLRLDESQISIPSCIQSNTIECRKITIVDQENEFKKEFLAVWFAENRSRCNVLMDLNADSNDGAFYCYLPLQESTNSKFSVHAQFKVNDDRTKIVNPTDEAKQMNEDLKRDAGTLAAICYMTMIHLKPKEYIATINHYFPTIDLNNTMLLQFWTFVQKLPVFPCSKFMDSTIYFKNLSSIVKCYPTLQLFFENYSKCFEKWGCLEYYANFNGIQKYSFLEAQLKNPATISKISAAVVQHNWYSAVTYAVKNIVDFAAKLFISQYEIFGETIFRESKYIILNAMKNFIKTSPILLIEKTVAGTSDTLVSKEFWEELHKQAPEMYSKLCKHFEAKSSTIYFDEIVTETMDSAVLSLHLGSTTSIPAKLSKSHPCICYNYTLHSAVVAEMTTLEGFLSVMQELSLNWATYQQKARKTAKICEISQQKYNVGLVYGTEVASWVNYLKNFMVPSPIQKQLNSCLYSKHGTSYFLNNHTPVIALGPSVNDEFVRLLGLKMYIDQNSNLLQLIAEMSVQGGTCELDTVVDIYLKLAESIDGYAIVQIEEYLDKKIFFDGKTWHSFSEVCWENFGVTKAKHLVELGPVYSKYDTLKQLFFKLGAAESKEALCAQLVKQYWRTNEKLEDNYENRELLKAAYSVIPISERIKCPGLNKKKSRVVFCQKEKLIQITNPYHLNLLLMHGLYCCSIAQDLKLIDQNEFRLSSSMITATISSNSSVVDSDTRRIRRNLSSWCSWMEDFEPQVDVGMIKVLFENLQVIQCNKKTVLHVKNSPNKSNIKCRNYFEVSQGILKVYPKNSSKIYSEELENFLKEMIGPEISDPALDLLHLSLKKCYLNTEVFDKKFNEMLYYAMGEDDDYENTNAFSAVVKEDVQEKQEIVIPSNRIVTRSVTKAMNNNQTPSNSRHIREIALAGELFVVEKEKERLSCDPILKQYACRVERVGDTDSFDVASFDKKRDGTVYPLKIEVKTTQKSSFSSFLLTENEHKLFQDKTSEHRIILVVNAFNNDKMCIYKTIYQHEYNEKLQISRVNMYEVKLK